jgi:hypothetical protein
LNTGEEQNFFAQLKNPLIEQSGLEVHLFDEEWLPGNLHDGPPASLADGSS